MDPNDNKTTPSGYKSQMAASSLLTGFTGAIDNQPTYCILGTDSKGYPMRESMLNNVKSALFRMALTLVQPNARKRIQR